MDDEEFRLIVKQSIADAETYIDSCLALLNVNCHWPIIWPNCDKADPGGRPSGKAAMTANGC